MGAQFHFVLPASSGDGAESCSWSGFSCIIAAVPRMHTVGALSPAAGRMQLQWHLCPVPSLLLCPSAHSIKLCQLIGSC